MPGFYAGEPIQNDFDYLDSMKKVEGKTSKMYQKKKLFSTRKKEGSQQLLYILHIYRMVLLLAVRSWILTSHFAGPCSYNLHFPVSADGGHSCLAPVIKIFTQGTMD